MKTRTLLTGFAIVLLYCGASSAQYYSRGNHVYHTLENRGYHAAQVLPNRPDVGSSSSEYYYNSERAIESARIVDSPDDANRILYYGIDQGGRMNAEGLRQAGVSDEGFGQLMDDANLNY